MLLDSIFDRFAQQSPVAVMVRGLLEHALSPRAVDALFEQQAEEQDTRESLLSQVVDVFPCEDGHTQERALLDQVWPTVEPNDVWIEDRNFCTLGFLFGIAQRGAYFVVRQHENLPWQAETELGYAGADEGVEVWEQ